MGEMLRPPIEPPFVSGARTAVRHDDGGQAASRACGGQRQVSGNLRPVRGAVGDGLNRRELDAFELRAGQQELPQRLVAPIEEVIAPGVDIAARPEQEQLLVEAGIDEPDQRQAGRALVKDEAILTSSESK